MTNTILFSLYNVVQKNKPQPSFCHYRLTAKIFLLRLEANCTMTYFTGLQWGRGKRTGNNAPFG